MEERIVINTSFTRDEFDFLREEWEEFIGESRLFNLKFDTFCYWKLIGKA